MVLLTVLMVAFLSRKDRDKKILLPFLIPVAILISLFLVISA